MLGLIKLMTYDIIIGRNESDKELFGKDGVIFLGKQYVKMGQTTSLSNNVYMDVNRAHVILISGKRGTGKSYSLSVIAEEIAKLPKEISNNLSVLMFDTMGVFWTMKYANTREEGLLEKWNLKPEGLNINVFTPKGYFDKYKEEGIATDFSFSIKPSELGGEDWCNLFNIDINDPIGILIERVVGELKESMKKYSIDDIIDFIREDTRTIQDVKDATENRFLGAKSWGLFDVNGTKVKDLVKRGTVSVLDVSCYGGVGSIRSLVVGLIAKKLFNERMSIRKKEEIENIKHGSGFLSLSISKKEDIPIVWLVIDEIHEFLPKEGKTPASDALIQVLREGRQPGLSLLMATQQPGEVHGDVITQSDVVISHRVTAKADIDSLNNMMQTYLRENIQKSLNDLPKVKGSAIVLDDNSERVYPILVRPKLSWHGGEEPSAVKKIQQKLDLGL